jgi:hypothetical protein
MPAVTFADGDTGSDQQNPASEDGVIPAVDTVEPADNVVVPGEETTTETPDNPEDPDASEGDETVIPDEYNTKPIGEDSFELFGDDIEPLPEDEALEILKNADEPYPVSIEFTPGSESGLWAARNSYWIYHWSMYCEDNQFDVAYSDGSTKSFRYEDLLLDDGEYYNGYYELGDDGNPIIYEYDAEGKPKKDEDGHYIIDVEYFWDEVQSEDGRLTDDHNKIVMVTSTVVNSGDKEYYYRKSSKYIEVHLQWDVAYANVRDTKGEFQAEYTGKDQKISLEKTDIISEFGEVKATKILSPSGGKIKTIGCHEIKFRIDNSEGNFETDEVTGYFNIFPKKVKSVKVTNPKKNAVKVTWKYSGNSAFKANLKKIKGFSVMIYDKDGNFITQKNVKKTKTAATLKSSKLKKGKKYQIEVRAYMYLKNGDYWSSEPVVKKITLQK